MFEAVWQMAAPVADAVDDGSDLHNKPMCSIITLVATAMDASALSAARLRHASITASLVDGVATARLNMH